MPTNRGLTYPLSLSEGGLKTSVDYDLIREAIYSVLETRPGERIMRPEYGTPDFVFDSVTNVGLIAERVRISLETQIADVNFDVTGTINEDGATNLEINWTVGDFPQPPIYYLLQV